MLVSWEKFIADWNNRATQGEASAEFISGMVNKYGLLKEDTYQSGMRQLWDEAQNEESSDEQFTVGWMLYIGIAFKRSRAMGEVWYRKAAEKDHCWGLWKLGCLHVGKDRYEMAFECYEEASQLGCARALVGMASLYHDGTGVPRDNQRAFDLLCLAREKGDALASTYLGITFQSGDLDCIRDMDIAIPYLLEGAEKDEPEALSRLAKIYQDGDGVEPDPKKALWYHQAAAKCEVVTSLHMIAKSTWEGRPGLKKDIQKAISLYEIAAFKKGDWLTHSFLAEMYLVGVEGEVEVDKRKGYSYAFVGTEGRQEKSALLLVHAYEDGDVLPQDEAKRAQFENLWNNYKS